MLSCNIIPGVCIYMDEYCTVSQNHFCESAWTNYTTVFNLPMIWVMLLEFSGITYIAFDSCVTHRPSFPSPTETDLHNVIKKGNVLEDIHRRYIMYQLFRAARYLHSGSVIHRDLKVMIVCPWVCICMCVCLSRFVISLLNDCLINRFFDWLKHRK